MPTNRRTPQTRFTDYSTMLAEAPPVEAVAVEETEPRKVRWEGVIGVEGEATGDGRVIEHGALRWDTLPIKLRHVASDVGAHDGAMVVGKIDTIERREGGKIWGAGDFDLGSDHGVEAMRQVENELTNGVSMDLDDVSFEIRVASDLYDEVMGEEGEDRVDLERTVGDDGVERVTVAGMKPDEELQVTLDARVRSATMVAIPAFESARIALSDEAEDTDEETPDEENVSRETNDEDELTAAAGPMRPPAGWFANPMFTQPTALTVTDDGRIFGHLAAWNTCHLSHTAEGQCVIAPKTAQDYAFFRTGSLTTKEGTEVSVGRITLDTGHAGPRLNPAATASHYDNTGTAIADVSAGEDAHGIWISGAIRATATAAQVRALKASPLSGDWRRIGGHLELVAALAVNVPGFPVPRPAGLVASGELESLVAAGMVPPRQIVQPGTPRALSDADLKYLKRLANREQTEERERMVLRVVASKNKMKVREFVAGRNK